MPGFLIKLLIGVAGLAVLAYFGSLDFTVLMHATGRPELLALALLCLLTTIPLAALRWWMLLINLGIRTNMRWTMNVTLISLFFHTFLPGAYGGDLVRLGMAYRATNASFSHLTFSVLVDRLTGLAALVLLGAVMIPALPEAYASRLEIAAAAAVGAGIAGLAVATLWGDWLIRMIGKLPSPLGPKLAHIAREMLDPHSQFLPSGPSCSVARLLCRSCNTPSFSLP